MDALNRVFSTWLAQGSVLALALLASLPWLGPSRGDAVPVLLASTFGLGFLAYGVLVAAREEGPGIRHDPVRFLLRFLARPANFVTAFRVSLVMAGAALATAGVAAGALLLTAGFFLDFFDGILARREAPDPGHLPQRLGPWFDAESDAVALLVAGWALVALGGASPLLLVPVGSRYAFGLAFSLLPLNPAYPSWYRWYSKTAAALLQTWLAVAWFNDSYSPPAWFSGLWQGPALVLVAVGIVVSFVLETGFRVATAQKLFSVPGLLLSFLRYYRVPFRSRRAERLYRRFLKPGDLVFDVGAHVGGRVDTLRRLGCRVVAFEPQPACVDLLRLWYGDRPEVTVVPQALGREEGRLSLFASLGNPTLTSLDPEWVDTLAASPEFQGVRWEKRGETSVTTLDLAIARFGTPRFVKLDVEGFEPAVLEGLSKGVEAYSFEFLVADKDRALRCLSLLRALGTHEFNFAAGESFHLEFEPWLTQDEAEAFVRDRRRGLSGGDLYARVRHG